MWLIRSEDDDDGYWSSDFGWVDRDQADRFTDEEKASLIPPIGGYWIKVAP